MTQETELHNAAKSALINNMGLKENESCLIIFDKNKKDIADSFYIEAKKIIHNVKLVEIPIAEVNGEEPPENVASTMQRFDVIIIVTTRSMTHTKARLNAIGNGARLASMPGITEDCMIRCMTADYNIIKKRTMKLVDLHNKGNKIRITTELGTDITMDISGLKCGGGSAGLFTKPGLSGNLPEGESNMAPKEGSTNGIFIVDLSIAGIGKLDVPLRITVKDGFATKIEGENANKLKDILDSVNDKRAYNIAEIGIGTNHKAVITGNILEDEKVMGTAHIALGNNMCYDGGTTDVPIHLDGVFSKPTICIDDKKIIENGKFLI